MKKIYVCDGDLRQKAIKKILNNRGILTENIAEAEIVIYSTPFVKEGKVNGTLMTLEELIGKILNKKLYAGSISNQARELLLNNNIKFDDIMSHEEIAIKNAIPTAEGTISIIQRLTQKTLYGQNILVLGFGKVGKILADRLYAMKANVFCEARTPKDLAHIYALGYNVIDIQKLNEYLQYVDVIVNTVPFLILDESRLKLLKKGAVIIDIASAPGGTDFEMAKNHGITAMLELGIPAKVAPYSSGEYVVDFVLKEEKL